MYCSMADATLELQHFELRVLLVSSQEFIRLGQLSRVLSATRTAQVELSTRRTRQSRQLPGCDQTHCRVHCYKSSSRVQ